MRALTPAAALRLGLKGAALGSNSTTGLLGGLSLDNSRGYKSCTGLSKIDLPALSLAPLTTPSCPVMSSSMMPSFHCPLFFSSDFISLQIPGPLTEVTVFAVMRPKLGQRVWLDEHERIWREKWKLDVFIRVRQGPVIECNFHI